MFKKIALLLILIAGFIIETTVAQTFVNSPYSYFGVGDLQDMTSVQNQGMGGLSIATRSDYSINLNNPAANSAFNPTSLVFDIGVQDQVNRLSSNGSSQTTNNVSFNYLAIGFPVTKKVGVFLGITPYSNVSYAITNVITVPEVGKAYSENYNGTGGLNRAVFGTAVKPFKNLSLGISGSYLFGSLNQTYRASFDSSQYSDTKITNNTTVGGLIFDLGLQYSLPVSEDMAFVFGAKYSNKFKINTTSNQLTTLTEPQSNINTDTVVNTTNQKGSIVIPQSWGFGLSLIKNDKFVIGVEFTTQQWSQATTNGISDSLKNTFNVRFGVEYIPNASAMLKGEYLKRVKYRFGFTYGQTYYNFLNQQVNKESLTLGLGLPLRTFKFKDNNYGPTFNISAEFGQIGTNSSNMISQDFMTIRFGIVIKDIWFEKSKIQ